MPEPRSDSVQRLADCLRQTTRILDGEIVLPQAALMGQIELNREALAEHEATIPAGTELHESGLSYCTAHHGVIDCDETRCDFWDPDDDRCLYCDGDSVVQRTGPDAKPDEFEDCGACDGTGVTRCSPKSLVYAAAPRGAARTEGSDG